MTQDDLFEICKPARDGAMTHVVIERGDKTDEEYATCVAANSLGVHLSVLIGAWATKFIGGNEALMSPESSNRFKKALSFGVGEMIVNIANQAHLMDKSNPVPPGLVENTLRWLMSITEATSEVVSSMQRSGVKSVGIKEGADGRFHVCDAPAQHPVTSFVKH